jgi:DNA mismatch repair protein MutL
MIIDQKRAHERILYERYIKSLNHNEPSSQTALFPVEKELNAVDYNVLSEISGRLELLGFNILFGKDNRIVIKGYPAGTMTSDPWEMLDIFIEEFRNKEVDLLPGSMKNFSAAMAGTASIHYGKALGRARWKIFLTLSSHVQPPIILPEETHN